MPMETAVAEPAAEVVAPAIPTTLNVDEPELAHDAAFFLKHGYLVVKNALSREQLASLRCALDETYARKPLEIIHALLEEDDRFAFLLDHPPVLRRMKKVLG